MFFVYVFGCAYHTQYEYWYCVLFSYKSVWKMTQGIFLTINNDKKVKRRIIFR
jgi:hypothetical protein